MQAISGQLEVIEAHKTYTAMGRTVRALRGISIRLPRGEVAVIIGSNGSGKSTLLQAIGGLLRLDSGAIQIAGRDVSRIARTELARMRGILYQEPLRSLCIGFTIAEMMSLYGDGIATTSFAQMLSTLERIGLDRDRGLSTLSVGQQQLLALELVLARSPAVLLLDEPTAALDVQNAEGVRARVLTAAKQGIAVVLVSHNLEEALAVADQLLLLHEGELVRGWRGEQLAGLREDTLRAFVHEHVAVALASAAGPKGSAGRIGAQT